MLYTKEVIDKTTSWISDNKLAEQWLLNNNFEELLQLKDALSRHAKALEYLLVKKHIVLAAFVNAVWDDQKAFKLLMDQQAFHWAATANYINGDVKAAAFLQKNKLAHYLELAKRIQEKIRKEGDEGMNFFNSGPFKIK
jgi:hypothetical protein